MLPTRIGVPLLRARTNPNYGISVHDDTLEKLPVFLQFRRKRYDFHSGLAYRIRAKNGIQRPDSEHSRPAG
jgi:hypothetical protein